MGETTDQIENHIETKREDLKANLQELKNRVKSAVNWRHYFQDHTGAMIAVAFGGGILLARVVGKRKGTPRVLSSNASTTMPERVAPSGTKLQVLKTWDNIKSALVGVAATKLKGMLSEVVPGFTEHLAKSEGDKQFHPGNGGGSAEIRRGAAGVPPHRPQS